MTVSLTSMLVVLNEPVSVSAEMSKIYVGGTTCYLGRHLVLLNHIVRAFTLLSDNPVLRYSHNCVVICVLERTCKKYSYWP